MESRKHLTLEGENIRISYREQFTPGEEIFENHCHARYEMIAVFEGKVTIVVDKGKYTLRQGEIVIIPPLVYHSVFAEDELTYKRATLLFDSSLIPSEIMSDFTEKTGRQSVSKHGSLDAPLQSLKSIFAEAEREKFLPLAKSLLTEIIYIHTYKDTSGKKEKSHPTVKAITEYIDLHITEKISLEGIADSVFLSKSTVSHLFAGEMKISVKQYVLQKKLSYAARLIEEGCSAGRAAEAVGYDNYANFYKMYKKVMGVSPRSRRV
ncbi:MAG: helix-turn-helix transcriptional regulator [Clostridia bacterium]|nr:helix-turn-helix transcriptional regulator [Clostridia bacterium]